MVFSPPSLNQQFKQAFNHTLVESDLDNLLQQLQIIIPAPGEPFWDASTSPAGIYLILEGKVRLLDDQDNLLVSLSEGMILGQISLFPEEQLQQHAARASLQLKLGYLSLESLQPYLASKPNLRRYLHRQALTWDLLLLYHHHNPEQNRQGIQNLLPILAKLEQHYLEVGDLSEDLLSQHLWLLRQGEIIHSSGVQIIPGKIYHVDNLPADGAWSIAKPTEIYTFGAPLSAASAKRSESSSSQLRTIPAQLANTGSKTAKIQHDLAYQTQQLYFPTPRVKLVHLWQQLSKRYPFRKQDSASDCGVACLVMIGQYWGKNFSISELRKIANVNRSGASLKGLITAAEYLGFAPRPVKADLAAVAKQTLPAIAHWQGNHYIVIYRITRDRVIIADPQIGRLNLTRQEFVQNWTGYTLLLTPTAQFERTPEAKRNIWKYLKLLKPHWLVLLEVV